MYFSESQFKPPLKNSWGCQMIRPFSAGLMSSPHFRPMFGHGFQRHFEATTQQPTSLNPQIPPELRWKRWWKPSILRPLEVSERPLRRGSKFLGFNANALHEWGILQRKHTTDIVGLWMMRQISLSQMFWWLKDCGSQSSRWLGWMYTDMHTCKTCTGTHVSQPYHHINININTNINIYIKRTIVIAIV